jgi:hypothetical protein
MRRNREVAALAGLTVTLGVAIFSIHTSYAFIGDGEVSAPGAFFAGLLMLSVPITALGASAVRRRPAMVLPVGVISVLTGGGVAVMRPGNMFLLGYLGLLVLGGSALVIAEAVQATAARWRRPKRT